MNAKFLVIVLFTALLCACSKNDSPAGSTAADYADTREKLIQNKESDSTKRDSTTVPTAMPPQPAHSENGH